MTTPSYTRLGPLAISAIDWCGVSSHNDKLYSINCKQVLKRLKILRGTEGLDLHYRS